MSKRGARRRDIIDSARLTLGYIYFELSDYQNALEQLNRITVEYGDYAKALLAKSWCSYKLQDYQEVITALNELKNDYPDFPDFEEVHFLLGQSYLKLGYFNFAVNEFQEILDNTPEVDAYPKIVERASSDLTLLQQSIQKMYNRVNNLEAELVGTIKIIAPDVLPAQAEQQRQNMQKRRDALLEELITEREDVASLEKQMQSLRDTLEKVEMQKRWRAYSEYGKVRAMFLQTVQAK